MVSEVRDLKRKKQNARSTGTKSGAAKHHVQHTG